VTNAQLIAAARAVRKNAWAPYSGFKVGAAILCEDGSVYAGCNVENVTFGLTTCAEQVAIMKAVSEGQRRFTRIAVVTGSSPPAAPCGLCRQMMAEFCEDLDILIAHARTDALEITTLRAILPRAFRPQDLESASE
jgi:cytidine deaminase